MTRANGGTHLVGIDTQKTFDERWPDLPVPGTKLTAERTARHIRQKGKRYRVHHSTRDTHPLTHMSLAKNYVDGHGNSMVDKLVGGYCYVSPDDILTRKVRYRWENNRPFVLGGKTVREHLELYVQEVGRIDLWNIHGIPDHDTWALQPEIQAAYDELALETGIDPNRVMKGYDAYVDQYGALKAAYTLNLDPSTGINNGFIETASTADTIAVCGVEGTHCVKSTFLQMVELMPTMVTKFVILEDLVAVLPNFGSPETNFPQQWEEFKADMVKLGVTITTSDKFNP